MPSQNAQRPRIIGLTGGLASGKSTVARMLRQLGAEVIDADEVARSVVEPGQPAYREIVAAFGADVLVPADNHTIDRARLGELVFKDESARRRLNAITHPAIAAESARRFAELAGRGVQVVIYDATLIVENGLHKGLEGVIVVDLPEEDQLRRAVARGLSESQAQLRIRSQARRDERLAIANWIIDNRGPLDATERQVAAAWADIQAGRRAGRRRQGGPMNPQPDVTLVTGFPGFPAQRLVRRLLETDPRERLFLLCQGRFQLAAEIFVRELPRQARTRVEILTGDAGDMDLGLAGPDYRRLCAELTAIHLLGVPVAQPAPAPPSPREGGRQGTAAGQPAAAARNIVDLAQESPGLRRLCYHSSTAVAGTRSGVVLEDELWVGQRFLDPRDEALMRAEAVVQKAIEERHLPATVLRTPAIVGDSRSGQIDRFGGPYALMRMVLHSPVLALPGHGAAPLHLAPIDFVTEAAMVLSRDPRAAGLTCHLTDPNPLSARAVCELVARFAGRKPPLRGSVPPSLVRAVARAVGNLSFLEEGQQMVFFNCQNTLRLLEGTGVRCPPVPSYIDRLLAYMQRVQKDARAEREEDVADPLD